MTAVITRLFTFRNHRHLTFFFMSIILLVISLLIFSKFLVSFAFWVPCVYHVLISLCAFYEIFIMKRTSEYYSIDCCWFNPAMVIIYIILIVKFV